WGPGSETRRRMNFGLGGALHEHGTFCSAEESPGVLVRGLTKLDQFATALGLFPRTLGGLSCSCRRRFAAGDGWRG
ncbi:MAG TPA: hypothetical protein VGM76_09245, partial [Lacipirellulaceae bacterium]